MNNPKPQSQSSPTTQVGNAANKQSRPSRRKVKDCETAKERIVVRSEITRKQQLIDLLKRPAGATIGDMTTAFNWQAHSARAALTGLRKAGHDIKKAAINEETHYSIEIADPVDLEDNQTGAAAQVAV